MKRVLQGLLSLTLFILALAPLIAFIYLFSVTSGTQKTQNPFTGFWWSIFFILWLIPLAFMTFHHFLSPIRCMIWLNMMTLGTTTVLSFVASLCTSVAYFVSRDAGAAIVPLFLAVLNISIIFLLFGNSYCCSEKSDLTYFTINTERSKFFHKRPKESCGGYFLLNIVMLLVLAFQIMATYQALSIAVYYNNYDMIDPRHILHAQGNDTDPVHQLVHLPSFGYSLHIYCRGKKNPAYNGATIVIDSGLGSVSAYWSNILPELANMTRTCVYDRAGYAWSDPGTLPRTSRIIADELAELLDVISERPPYVVMGHSFGGLNVRLFTSLHSKNVTGMMLIDAATEFQEQQSWKALNITEKKGNRTMKAENLRNSFIRSYAPLGIWRMLLDTVPGMIFEQLSPEFQDEQKNGEAQNGWLQATWSEAGNMNTESSAQVQAAKGSGFGSLPLVVLTAGQSINGTCQAVNIDPNSKECTKYLENLKVLGPLHQKNQQALAKLSSDSTWQIVWPSGHNIALEYPQVVVSQTKTLLQKSAKYHPK